METEPGARAREQASSPAPAVARVPPPVETVVGLSGGVDSAVALALLARAGRRVRAIYMKNWDEDDDGPCPAAEDLEMAARVCDRLEVELSTVNFSYEYWERVFTRFLDEHRTGRTPNPDVLCNSEVKFDAFLGLALDQGASKVATGHHARIEHRNGQPVLLRGADPGKDQSYFLHGLDQRQIAHAEFPIGHLQKREVRRLARELALAPSERKDSTGICFIGERPFQAFLERFLGPSPGIIESVEGERLGEHRGLAFYTIGQRQGLGIGGRQGDSGAPWYVAAKDLERQALIVAQGRDHPALAAGGLRTEALNWIGPPPPLPLRCTAKIRYRQPDQGCVVRAAGESGAEVRFDQPQWAVAPGQSVVFYAGEICLGGAVIASATPP